MWLAPVQVVVATVTNKSDDYAKKVFNILEENNIRSEIDISSEKIGYKIRKYSKLKTPLIFVIGEKEKENNTVQVRTIWKKEQETLELSEIPNKLNKIKDITI